MLERIRRGWGITKAGWAVLRLHPKLLVLPVFSLIAFLALLAAIAASVFAGAAAGYAGPMVHLIDGARLDHPLAYAILFAFYFACVSIAVFFNAALVFCTLEAFAGRTPSLRAGLGTAVGRLPQILAWALVASTVGLALNMLRSALRERLGFLGALLGGVLEVAWAVLTYFVVPVLVVDGVGPIEAVKRSSAILKRTWGETAGSEGSLGIITFLLMLPAAALVAIIALAPEPNLRIAFAVIVPVIVLYVLTLSLVLSALGSVVRTGVYVYATTGKAPSGMDPALLQATFRRKG